MPTVNLTWDIGSVGATEQRVYRAQVSIDPEALPAPLAILNASAVEYSDATVVLGETYFYRISAVRQDQEVVSDQVTAEIVEAAEGRIEVSALKMGAVVSTLEGITNTSALKKGAVVRDIEGSTQTSALKMGVVIREL